ncbi:alpha-amylase [Aspergillus heteromorphus CBS 117.55]|uniref:Alpha-amylase n=1 Tax=Aspergillus heteromorphus CBS 117.55 TaxID=1448321 RepID=A0A317VIV9_9EURO|nr:alpha-amylase [Aspergillus heteromorphus CBS 117.55]PWY72968.1 alpha-amylase [Aspergillus heteromorphus CBS 117.55]
MLSFLTACRPRRRKGQQQHQQTQQQQHHQEPNWKEIEEKASHLPTHPSYHTPTPNSTLFETFEWHTPSSASSRHYPRLRAALPALHAAGITDIWLPPGCKGMDAHGNGYDIYDLYDLGEFEQKGATSTKWGSRGELEELLGVARELGVGVVWDAVLNHRAGADGCEAFEAVRVREGRRDIETGPALEINGWTRFDFPGRGSTYSTQKYNWNHFSGVDWDDKRQEKAIFKIRGAHKTGWADDVGKENGNYDYLMFADVDYANAEVRADVLRWGAWISSLLSLKGMRLDAAKHFSMGFQREFIDHVRRETDAEFWVMGEYWSGDVKELVGYLEEMEYRVSAVDVPLVVNFSRLSRTPGADLRRVLEGTLVECRPDNALSEERLIDEQTFVANHDTQPGQMLENVVSPQFKPLAYALILLRKGGQPCVFYGDLYGVNHGDKPLTPACEGKLPLLTRTRQLYAYGEQQDYFDQPNCIGFIRYGNALHPSGLACVLSNGAAAQKRMYVGANHGHEKWTDVLHDEARPVVIDESGYGVFPVPRMGVSVWVNAAAPGRDSLALPFDANIYQH